VMDVALGDILGPLEVVDAFHPLEVHGDAFRAIGELGADGIQIDAAALLEIGELGDLHAVEPHFPAQPPGPQSG